MSKKTAVSAYYLYGKRKEEKQRAARRLNHYRENAKEPNYVKVRAQGTLEDLDQFERFLKRQSTYRVLSVSESLPNKGTTRYFRKYAELVLLD